MSDANVTSRLSLGDALRALPLATPTQDGWPALAARLVPAAPRRRRRYLPLAVAAACVLALASALSLRHTPPTTAMPAQIAATVASVGASSTANGTNAAAATNMTNATNTQIQQSDASELASAQARSQALERWLHDTRRAASPLPSQDLAAATEIENLIGLVDVELAASTPTGTLPLWHRRVALLEDLTALRYSNYRLAEIAAATPAAGTLNEIN
ncbi:MAG: hypothetical protein P4L92_13285 [Rudaea sp.]|nr:hypothetical protein [Rudaea sp.]